MSWSEVLASRRKAAVAGLIQGAWRFAERAGTVTAESAAGRRFASFGPGSLMAFPAGSVYGERWIEVGASTMLAANVTLCAGLAPGHDLGPHPVLRVGSRCVIGRGSHIVAHYSIEIGDDVYTGPYVYITDQNHSYEDPDTPIGAQWPTNAGVSIGSGTWLGTGAVILPGCVIGRNVVVAAGAVVRGRVPDRCVVAGVPARVVREYVPGAGWIRAPGAAAWLAEPDGVTPTESGSTSWPAEPGSFAQPAEPGSFAQPAEPGSFAQPAEPGGACPPAEPGGSAQPAEPGSSAQPAEPGSVG